MSEEAESWLQGVVHRWGSFARLSGSERGRRFGGFREHAQEMSVRAGASESQEAMDYAVNSGGHHQKSPAMR